MKRIPLIGLVFLFLSCNSSSDSSSSRKDSSHSPKTSKLAYQAITSAPPVNLAKYLVPEPDAKKMKKYVKGCVFGCKVNINIVDRNPAAYAELLNQYPPPAKIDTAVIRYKESADEARYRAARGFANSDRRGGVKKFKNIIYVVTHQIMANKLLVDEILYYDTMTICPPPEGDPSLCAALLDSSASNSDSTKKRN